MFIGPQITLTMAILMAWLLSGNAALAAPSPSFDCAKARTPIELLICDDESLSQLDRDMGKAYTSAMHILPEKQKNELKQEQRQWLANRLERCHVTNKTGERIKNPARAISCLLKLYQNRIHDLSAATAEVTPPASSSFAETRVNAKIEMVSPRGVVRNIRQVVVRFNRSMVPFGDPRAADPMQITCPIPGKGHWADDRNWLYDFDHDLPAGVQCSAHQKKGLQTFDGLPLTEDGSFSFSTGGPNVVTLLPDEGTQEIDEDQIFLLGLDTPARSATIISQMHCQTPGIAEKIGIRILSPEERKPLLLASESLIDYYLDRLSGSESAVWKVSFGMDAKTVASQALFMKLLDHADPPIIAVQCQRHFPPGSQIELVWGAGIQSPSGVASANDRVLHFKVREPFFARLSCERVNKDADCLPIRPFSLHFNAPVSRVMAEQIVLRRENETRRPHFTADQAQDPLVQWVKFEPPFPENSTFALELPAGFKDDAGRDLANRNEFPLPIKVDELPPLAKFPASFGIIEAKGEPALPVTLRNLETVVMEDPGSANQTASAPSQEQAQVRGRMLKVPDPKDFPAWFKRIHEVQREKSHYDQQTQESVIDQMIGETSVFTDRDTPSLTTFKLPRPDGAKIFEVMGIPMPGPGFYVVELASQRLGAALHGQEKPYFVQTAALVTNMAAHFFRGRESSLVWVTALDSGLAVAGADVSILDCNGHIYARGLSDKDGLLRIHQELPALSTLPQCPDGGRFYIVSARMEDDITFVLSSWNNGIERWAFNLPGPRTNKPIQIHAILDRSLFRAGETVHMKYLLRKSEGQGFAFPDKSLWPKKAIIRHAGGGNEYPLSLTWDTAGVAESRFDIPKEAKLGTYEIVLDSLNAGSFRVEAFRVPLMKGVIKPVEIDVINASQAQLDVQVNYLAGGAASLAPIKIRGMLQSKSVTFPEYPEFTFANHAIQEGRTELGRSRNDDGNEEASETGPEGRRHRKDRPLAVVATHLDQAGGGRVMLSGWEAIREPKNLQAEMEYRDPNGETQIASTRVNLWPSAVVPGIRMDKWLTDHDQIGLNVLTLNTAGQAVAGIPVTVDILERKTYSHRKRLLGGFYAYDQYEEIKKIKEFCSGRSDASGRVDCQGAAPAKGNLIVQVRVTDAQGHGSSAHTEIWVPEDQEGWFTAREGDRMDLLPEKRHYEPGDTATLQVRMPFRQATALVVVEREGVMETSVQPLQGQTPLVSVPILGNYGPNVFVAVLAVRGRSGDSQPTAMIDMGRPAMRLGIANLQVGWQDYALNVGVKADRAVYTTRDNAEITVTVQRANGKPLPAGGEMALAAVDEGLLELMPNASWNVLEGMLVERGLEVETATAMGRVIGKRHFGKKALPQGGGGGRSSARKLFDTLLMWQGRVKLDSNGMAKVKIPLNDSITAFRIVAIATAGANLFGTGSTSIRATREVMLFSGLPPVVRQGDRFQGEFTVRNAGEKPFQGRIQAVVTPQGPTELPVQEVTLAPGEAREIVWNQIAPAAGHLTWEVEVQGAQASDRIQVTQDVLDAVPIRVIQSTLSPIDKVTRIPVATPQGALPGRGGLEASLAARITDELSGVREYMQSYPYTCMEQRTSRAITLNDHPLWDQIVASLPSYLDQDGLVKFFPTSPWGSDALTSYILAVSATAGWTIDEKPLQKMKKGLTAFVEGKILRQAPPVTPDLGIRKLAALAALARLDTLDPKLLGSMAIEPDRWPTSTLIDWIDLLSRMNSWPDRDHRKREALTILRARLNFSGTHMRFSTETSDYFWWLMISPDVNANRALLAVMNEKEWHEDAVRMLKGTLLNRQRGHWSTSTANAWGTLAVQQFAKTFEGVRVTGTSTVISGEHRQELSWSSLPKGGRLDLTWPPGAAEILVQHQGSGTPWLTLTSRAAIPLQDPVVAGYRMQRHLTPVTQQKDGEWHRGDVYRVHLELEAQTDMTWVVVDDPIPGGSTILGGGLGKDSQILTQGENKLNTIWPVFTERTFDSFRAYHDWVPKGHWTLEYTVRLNTPGVFRLPPSHAEAMYAPEIFGDLPNQEMTVLP
ncbi:MAG: DUF1311 domain-containing protein [Magnetococcales bacterium]|nr:DUF1311 domain-containing protein [Magnetococcales bacterium]